MKKLTCLLFILLIGTYYTNASINPRYYAIIDAGSSGSRIHLYKYQNKNNNVKLETLKLKKNKVTPGLSSIANCPDKVGEYLQPLIDSVNSAITSQGIEEKNVNFYLLATAGMRVISPVLQKNIYRQLKKYIKENTDFKTEEITTIPGKHEGAFDWIAYNYLAKKLFTDKTMGILDMGGASVEIAFATNKPIFNPGDKVEFMIGAKKFTIFSHSYLGLGQNLAISQYTNDSCCFPKGYPLPNEMTGSGEFKIALLKIENLVNVVHNVNKPSTIIPDADKFVGVSGFYYTPTSKPFGLGQNISIKALKARGTNFGQRPWADSEKRYSNDPFLYIYYFSSAFISVLLEKGFGFNENTKFNVVNDVDGIDISWTLGAVIYYAEGNAGTKKGKNTKLIQKQKAA
jgi:apyrase